MLYMAADEADDAFLARRKRRVPWNEAKLLRKARIIHQADKYGHDRENLYELSSMG